MVVVVDMVVDEVVVAVIEQLSHAKLSLIPGIAL